MRPAAVLAGFMTDLMLTFAFTALVISIVGGESADEVSRRMRSSLELLVSLSLVGLAFTGVGGYVAAWLARQRHVEHALAVGLLSLGLGIGCTLTAPGDAPDVPAWLSALGYLLTVPAAALGGWYRRVSEAEG